MTLTIIKPPSRVITKEYLENLEDIEEEHETYEYQKRQFEKNTL